MRIQCWKCSGRGKTLCTQCAGKREKVTPRDDGTVSRMACLSCDATGITKCEVCRATGSIDRPDATPNNIPPVDDPLAGVWAASGESWVISKTGLGYQVVENGAAGPVGEGRVTSFDGDTVVVTMSSNRLGPRQDVLRLRGKHLRKVNGFPVTFSRV